MDPDGSPPHQGLRPWLGDLVSWGPLSPTLSPTFRLFVLMVQDHIRGMAQAPCQVDQRTVSEFMNLEHTIIDVGDTIDVILKDINAEGMT